MKILMECPHTDDLRRAELVIHRPADMAVLTIRVPRCPPRDFVINPATEFRPWSMMHVHGSKSGGPYINRDPAARPDWTNTHRETVGIDPRAYATFAWGETPADLLVIAWKRCFTDLPFGTTGTHASVLDKIDGQLPGFMAAYGQAHRAKAAVFRDISPWDSLAALEEQVDLLTDLVFALMSDEAAPAWAMDFFAAVGANRSTLEKGEAEAIADVRAHKARLRAAIGPYLQMRNAARSRAEGRGGNR